MLHITAIVGTNHEPSTNRLLLRYLSHHFSDTAAIELVEIDSLPPFSKDSCLRDLPEIQLLEEKIAVADGVIFGTPEYDHAVPAVLLNALEWLSIGKQPLVAKPVMIVGASYGTLGTSRAQAQLRQVLNSPELSANVLPTTQFQLSHSLQAFDENGILKDAQIVQELENVFDEFLQFIDFCRFQVVHQEQKRKKIHQISSEKIEDYRNLEEKKS